MYDVYFSPSFSRKLKKIIKKNPRLKSKVLSQVKTLAKNPKGSSLRLHKLSGQNNWSISVTSDLRIIFSIKGKTVLCSKIGTHDGVY